MPGKLLAKVGPTWLFYLVIAGMFIVGLTLRFAIPGYVEARWPRITPNRPFIDTIAGVGEALIVAALLAGVVDPYVKLRLGKEVGREIAKETAGEHLPEELRKELEGMQDIKLYMRNMTVDCTLAYVRESDGLLKWHMTMHYEVENASWRPRPFEHRLAITDEEVKEAQMKIIEVAHNINGSRKYRLRGTDREFTAMCDEKLPLTVFTYAYPTQIRSTRCGPIDKCEYFTTTERLVPSAEIQVIQVSLPTIGVTLTVRHPPNVKIETSLEHIDGCYPDSPEGEVDGEVSRWRSDRAYLSNEHLWVMYERREIQSEKIPPLTPPIPNEETLRKVDTIESGDAAPA